MIRATMSRLSLLGSCQWWARPEVTWVEQSSDDASFGTSLHALAEAYVEGKPLPKTEDLALAAVWEKLRAWIDANRRAGWRSEIAFAYHVQQDTAREIPRTQHRDYSSAGPVEMCGTSDLVYMNEDEHGPFACVDDYKWRGFHGDANRAQAQLGALALCVARAWGIDRVRARAIRVSPEGVDDTTEVYWLDSFDLEAMAYAIRDAVARIESAEPSPGSHCSDRWCPAISSCPSTREAIVQLVPDTALVRKEWRYAPVIESPDHAAWLLTIRPMLRKAMEQVDAAITSYVQEGPVVTSDGREIKQTFRNTTRLNAAALEELARAKGATDEEIAGCFRPSTESSGVRVVGGAKRGRAA